MLNFLNGTVSNQIYFIYGLIGLVLVLILTIILIDFKDKKKNKKKIKLSEPVSNLKQGVENIEIPELIEEVVEPVAVQTNEEITYVDENPELERTNALVELQKLTAELQKAEEENNNSSNIDLTTFEEEQESNAIISIQDLLKRNNELYENNECSQYKDEGNEPINIEELKKKFEHTEIVDNTPSTATFIEKEEISTVQEAPVYKQVVLEDFITGLDTSAKTEATRVSFKSTPFISPVYGIVKEPYEAKEEPIYDKVIELEQTADLDQLDGELRKTNEFLQVLKELQKNMN